MTTGDCCHLPGSLCDCTGNTAFSKIVADPDLGHPQYVTQVTAKDGRLLSTVIKALGTQSDGPICRICHEGSSGEVLLSPCDCTGTLGTVHKSCLEKWLSSSNTSYCELCHTEFVVERRPRPLTEVSFRYHCQLYSEWRRTNQKVRLMILDSENCKTAQHSLLSAMLLKKTAEETTV
ncbi:E3 ubiquitin-protein ligase MARCHF2 isoform X2 [Phascolarctos cinereus]|uniref:E3 ubiquitin-protein ligase MARCHF2 n=1 Tax=Phascolarctos cinereus TaxID=38626 RepID=A0A6P5JKJ1_PHACI|nr:E3 ubiquitin-protein ligase MARCH2 isoform X2 [Phascolarctos cinereus]XP_027699996.1 E3 ubiquitin-protein ligase MARCH2 isoform X2 [Vombatus ursinus]